MNVKQKMAVLINLAFFIFFTLSIYFLLKYTFAYLIPFLVSFAFVYISQVPAISLQKKTGVSKNLLTLLILILIIIFVGLFLSFILFKLIGLFSDLLSSELNFENILSSLSSLIDGMAESFPNGVKKYIDFDSTSVIDGVSNYLSRLFLDLFEDIMRVFPGFIFSTIISIVFACFLAFDYDKIVVFIKRQLNNETIKFFIRLKQIVNYSLFNLFKGYLILMFITFVEVCIGLTIVGIKNSVAVSFIIAFVDLLPVFGTGIILVPWGIYLLLAGNIPTGVGILILYVLCAAVRYFAEPKIIGKKVGLSPLVSLLTMFIGLKLFGVMGLISFPVIASITLILQKNGYVKLWK